MIPSLRFSAVQKLIFPESIPVNKREYVVKQICDNLQMENTNDEVTFFQNSKGDYVLLTDDKTGQKDASQFIEATKKSFNTHFISNKDKLGRLVIIENNIGTSAKIYQKERQTMIDKFDKIASDAKVTVKNLDNMDFEITAQ